MTREDQLEEAIRRLKILNVHENAVSETRDGTVNYSEYYGVLYRAEEEMKIRISRFESAHIQACGQNPGQRQSLRIICIRRNRKTKLLKYMSKRNQ